MKIKTRIEAAALGLCALFAGFSSLALARHGGPLLNASVFFCILAMLLAARCGQEIRDAEALEARKAARQRKIEQNPSISITSAPSSSQSKIQIPRVQAAQPKSHIASARIEAPTLARPTLAASAPKNATPMAATVDIDLDFTTELPPIGSDKTVRWERPIA